MLWGETVGRALEQAVLQSWGLTPERVPELFALRAGGASGIPGVAVKCVDIRKNTSGEGGFLDRI